MEKSPEFRAFLRFMTDDVYFIFIYPDFVLPYRKLRTQLRSEPRWVFTSTVRRISSVTGPLRAIFARIAPCSSSTLISSKGLSTGGSSRAGAGSGP